MDSPEAIGPGDVLDPGSYERVRPRYREIVSELRRERRVRIGESAVVLFENRETVLWQVHEVLRCEGANPARLRRVVADYDPILPRPLELRATVMIDGDDPSRARTIAAALRNAGSLELRCGRTSCASMPTAPPVMDGDPVWYLRWCPPAAWIERVRRGDAPLSLHPRWTSAVVIAPASTRRQLARDLDLGARSTPSVLHTLVAAASRVSSCTPSVLRAAGPR